MIKKKPNVNRDSSFRSSLTMPSTHSLPQLRVITVEQVLVLPDRDIQLSISTIQSQPLHNETKLQVATKQTVRTIDSTNNSRQGQEVLRCSDQAKGSFRFSCQKIHVLYQDFWFPTRHANTTDRTTSLCSLINGILRASKAKSSCQSRSTDPFLCTG